MKKQIFTLFLVVLLVAAIAGCSSAQDQTDAGVPAQETSAAIVETPMLESTEPAVVPPEAGDLGGQEGISPTEESAAPTVEPIEPGMEGDLATEEPALAPTEPGDLMTEEQATIEAMPSTVEPGEAPQAAVTTEPEEVLAPTGSVDINRLSNLLDFEVWNHANEQIGEVNAMVINQDTSQIEFVVIGVGGFLGLGEKDVPVPWPAFQLNVSPLGADTETDSTSADSQMSETPQKVFILDADMERLEQAPEIDLSTIYEPEVAVENQAEDQTQETEAISFSERVQEINSYWQSNVGQTTDEMNDATMTAHFVLADDLLGATLVDQAGQADVINEAESATTDAEMADQPADTTQQSPVDETQMAEAQDLGEVQEALVDTTAGRITYLLASLNDVAVSATEEPGLVVTVEPLPDEEVMAADEWVFVPLQVVTWDSEDEVLVYTGSESLEEAPAISEEDIQSGVTPTIITDADSFWGVADDMSSDDAPSDTTQ
jgi:sporulation protein YlmC with PRC-barrel domain